MAPSWSDRIVAPTTSPEYRLLESSEPTAGHDPVTAHTRECSQMSDERKVREVMARYVRSTDARDGVA
ncbi:MAG: hypothetical protein QOH69_3051 [Actinomycetota bacterium]|jgi:hypothetical protein|nr:hypothetical protein [Actinomycetota bacterium]